MTSHILSPELNQQFEALRVLLQRALWLAEKSADVDASQILRARLGNLQSAALIVIVGEVKAGKSSFINALLREDVCEVAPGPCTVRIQELVYGAERSVVSLGPSWERVYLPKDVLREVTLVDTPGTNSIIHDHQTITENYVPQSDLVVFVFSAANPHTKTAWELLTVIRKEWHRKMVFVLQQCDRASESELTMNRELVKQYARDRQVQNPTVFTLSAKRELEGTPEGEFAEFRDFLRYGIECGEVWRTKVEGSYQTIRTVMGKLLSHLRKEKAVIADERAFYQDLLAKVEEREAKTNALKISIVDQLSATYDRLARESEDDFADSLNIGELFRRVIPFSGGKDDQSRLIRLKGRFQESARKAVAKEAPRLAHNLLLEMQAMMEELSQTIALRQERMRENVLLPQTNGGHAETLERLRSKLATLRVAEPAELAKDTTNEGSDLRKLMLAGGGLAGLGVLIAALAQNFWLDVTGGALAVVGAFLVAAGLFARRTVILRDFREKLGSSRKEFQDRLEAHMNEVFEGLFDEVRQALRESVFRLEVQTSFIEPLLQETFQVGEAAAEMILRSQRIAVRPSSTLGFEG